MLKYWPFFICAEVCYLHSLPARRIAMQGTEPAQITPNPQTGGSTGGKGPYRYWKAL